MDLRTNGDYFTVQLALVCIYNANLVFMLAQLESYNITGTIFIP